MSADQVSDTQTAPVETAVSTQPDTSSATGAVVTATSATLTTDATTDSTKQDAVEPVSTPAPVTDTTTTAPVAPTTEVTADQAVVDTPAVQQASTTPNATQESAQPAANNTTVAQTWDYATDTNVQATIGTTINGVENSKGDIVANGGDFTQSNSARVMNGYSGTVSIDNTKEMYHNGDTIQIPIPIYGKMVSANSSVDTQNFDVVSAKGLLMNSGKTIGTYVFADGHLAITLTYELLGVFESTLNITGTDASPVASTAIWLNEKANATVYFGNSQGNNVNTLERFLDSPARGWKCPKMQKTSV